MSTVQFIIILVAVALVAIVILATRRKPDTSLADDLRRQLQNAHDNAQKQIEHLESLHEQREKSMKELFDAQQRKDEQRYNASLKQLKDDQRLQLAAIENANKEQLAAIKARYEEQRQEAERAAKEKFNELRRQTEAQFKSLSADITKAQTDALRTANKEQIEAVLNPLKENIESFKKSVNECYTNENASRTSLSDQVRQLIELNNTISSETRALTRALKGDSKVQGDWGEMILVEMLEKAGLERGVNFEAQATRNPDGTLIENEEGGRLRPDVLVNMPDKRNIIIDSKVSLTAYVEFTAAATDADRAAAGKAHLASVRKHINELADKEYQKQVARSAEHVFMFIPNEGAFMTAASLDPGLWQYAFTRHVAIVSPTHLFSMMQIISQLWRQDKQNKNTAKIAQAGGALYDQFSKFAEVLDKLGKTLGSAQDQYAEAYKRLTSGKQNIVLQTQKLRELGAKVSKQQIPQKLLDEAGYEEPEAELASRD